MNDFTAPDIEQIIADDEALQLVRSGLDLAEGRVQPTIRFLLRMAEIEANNQLESLLKVDPTHNGAVAVLQARVTVLRSLDGWIQQAVDQGLDAERQIKEREEYPD